MGGLRGGRSSRWTFRAIVGRGEVAGARKEGGSGAAAGNGATRSQNGAAIIKRSSFAASMAYLWPFDVSAKGGALNV